MYVRPMVSSANYPFRLCPGHPSLNHYVLKNLESFGMRSFYGTTPLIVPLTMKMHVASSLHKRRCRATLFLSLSLAFYRAGRRVTWDSHCHRHQSENALAWKNAGFCFLVLNVCHSSNQMVEIPALLSCHVPHRKVIPDGNSGKCALGTTYAFPPCRASFRSAIADKEIPNNIATWFSQTGKKCDLLQAIPLLFQSFQGDLLNVGGEKTCRSHYIRSWAKNSSVTTHRWTKSKIWSLPPLCLHPRIHWNTLRHFRSGPYQETDSGSYLTSSWRR